MRLPVFCRAYVFSVVMNHAVYRRIYAAPFFEKLVEDVCAAGRKAIEALVTLVFLAPFACEEPLGFEAAEERVEGAFVDDQSIVGKGFSEGVAVLFRLELGEDSDDEAAAAQFEAQGVEEVGSGGGGGWSHRLCGISCVMHTVRYMVYGVKGKIGLSAVTNVRS